jgi:PAS domain S-box-containing protein
MVVSAMGCGERGQNQNALGTAPLPFVTTAMDGTIEYANPAYRKMLGYTAEELSKLTYQQLTPPKWHDVEKIYIKAANDMPFVRYEKEYVTKGGTIIPIEITGWVVRDAGGNPVGTAAFAIDLTEYLREEKLEHLMGLSAE